MDNTDVFDGYRFDYEHYGDSKGYGGITIYKKSGRIPMPLMIYDRPQVISEIWRISAA